MSATTCPRKTTRPSTPRATRTASPVAIGMGLTALTAAMLLGACSSADTGSDSVNNPTTPPVSLKQFDGPQACESLEAAIETAAVDMMRAQLEHLADYADRGAAAPVPVTAPAPDNTNGDAGQGNLAESVGDTPNYSETNVQVAGVDELDTVKNDGQFLYTLGQSTDGISVTQAALQPATAMALVDRLSWPVRVPGSTATSSDALPVRAPEYPVGLFLRAPDAASADKELIAITSGSGFYAFPMIDTVRTDIATAAPLSICVDTGCGPGLPEWAPPHTVVRGLSVSGTGLASTWRVELPGQHMASRRVGNHATIVTQAMLQLPDTLRWWPQSDGSDPIAWRQAVDALIASNEQTIRSAGLDHWLAPLRDDTSVAPTPAECSSFATPDIGSRLSWTRIHRINLDTQAVSAQTVMTNGQAFYMNTSALVMTAPYWAREPNTNWFDGGSGTLVHRFSIAPDAPVQYEASATLNGTLINRFAIDEQDGVIRVAMTHRTRDNPYTYLATLGAGADGLQTIGKTDPIAPGETLQSARFVGDRAYLVTFEVIDPFFVYDLADPANPVELGELKIPGFSSYLHPVGPNHVLGIGYDSGDWPRRIKASLFDVTNPASPIEQSVLLLGETYTGSSALWDPHAFTFYRPDPQQHDGIMAIPFRSYASRAYGTQHSTGIRLVDVQTNRGEQGLGLRGTLDMSDLLGNATDGWRLSDARRAVFVGQNVYGVADGAVRSARIDRPGSPLDTLLLQ